MTLAELHSFLADTYHGMQRQAGAVRQNVVLEALPVALTSSGSHELLPASSIAVQSLVGSTTPLHDVLLEVVAWCREAFPQVDRVTLWQPAQTFHLNVVILRRLTRGGLLIRDRRDILDRAAPCLDWLEKLAPYELEFTGVRVGTDGTVIAIAYPLDLTPWSARRRFEETGFPDQQRIFHVSLGRMIEALPPPVWRDFVGGVERELLSRRLGTLRVQDALLVSESRGFLHSSACYDVLRRYHWSPASPLRGTPD